MSAPRRTSTTASLSLSSNTNAEGSHRNVSMSLSRPAYISSMVSRNFPWYVKVNALRTSEYSVRRWTPATRALYDAICWPMIAASRRRSRTKPNSCAGTWTGRPRAATALNFAWGATCATSGCHVNALLVVRLVGLVGPAQ